MSTFTRTTATEWVCTDCHLTIAGYSADELGHEHPAPFAGIEGIEDVTNGTAIEDCDTPECVAAVANLTNDGSAYDFHDECDHDSFSLHPCAGCGSTLAGDRYAVTVSYIEWDEPAAPVCALTKRTNHSEDIVTVWHGELTPWTLCGYHATYVSANTIRRELESN